MKFFEKFNPWEDKSLSDWSPSLVYHIQQSIWSGYKAKTTINYYHSLGNVLRLALNPRADQRKGQVTIDSAKIYPGNTHWWFQIQ